MFYGFSGLTDITFFLCKKCNNICKEKSITFFCLEYVTLVLLFLYDSITIFFQKKICSQTNEQKKEMLRHATILLTVKRNMSREHNSQILVLFSQKKIIMNLICYGYLKGKIKLIKDLHHDEVFIEETGLVLMRNNIWFYNDYELVAIANEILGDKT